MDVFFVIMLITAAIGLTCVGFQRAECTKISNSTLDTIIRVTLVIEYAALILHFIFK